MTDEDDAIVAIIKESSELASLGVVAWRHHPFGAMVTHRERPIGIWSFVDGAFRLRTLASWAPIVEAATLMSVPSITLELLDQGAKRHDYA